MLNKIFIIIFLFLNFSFSSSYSLTFKDGKHVEEVSIEKQIEKIDSLIDSFIETTENGEIIDFELLSKKSGFESISDAIKSYNKIYNSNINYKQLEDAFSFDRTRVNYSEENFSKLYNLVISSNYKSGIRYRKKYLSEPLNRAFAISMNLEKELARLSKDSNMKEITAHTWTWRYGHADNDIQGMIDKLIEGCENDILKYKIPFQKCYVIDLNGRNFLNNFYEDYIKSGTRELKIRN